MFFKRELVGVIVNNKGAACYWFQIACREAEQSCR